MEKAKNIVLVVCGIMLFFGSQAAYGTWLYIIVWAIGVAMLVFGIVGLHKNRSNRKAEASKGIPQRMVFMILIIMSAITTNNPRRHIAAEKL